MSGTKITKFHVDSWVQCRFATTTITSVVSNLESVAREIVFKALLPNSAFICHFSMTVDGKLIVAEVKEKAEAKRKYIAARAQGQTAGLAAQSIRETNTFEISTNVSANGSAQFELTYQEILQRVNGVYKHVININPGQVVDYMRIDVAVAENAEITKFRVPSVGPKVGEKTNTELMAMPNSPDVEITDQVTQKQSTVGVTYSPTVEQQREQLGQGISGQFVLLYDVSRDNSSGEIEVVDGYFVHFFAPSGLPTGSKRVLFVLDQSGSMQGPKIKQLKTAMKAILAEVREIDFFNIITFSGEVNVWKPRMIAANAANVLEAQEFIDRMPADGYTAIYDAMRDGLALLDDPGTCGALSSMIVFLTDGEATIGETRPAQIVEAISGWNATAKHRIHCVAFGHDAHYEMLKQISGRNRGLARKVFVESDAAIQLKGFYTEISSPLLSDISIKYIDESVDVGSLARSSDHDYVDGSEILVLGRLSGDLMPQKQSAAGKPIAVIKGIVQGRGAAGECRYDISHPIANGARENSRDPHVTNHPLPRNTVGGFVERMWAYLTIQKLLEQAKFSEADANKQATLRMQALDLSLKYHFVTELTSLVVTKDQETDAIAEVSASDSRSANQGMSTTAVPPVDQQQMQMYQFQSCIMPNTPLADSDEELLEDDDEAEARRSPGRSRCRRSRSRSRSRSRRCSRSRSRSPDRSLIRSYCPTSRQERLNRSAQGCSFRAGGGHGYKPYSSGRSGRTMPTASHAARYCRATTDERHSISRFAQSSPSHCAATEAGGQTSTTMSNQHDAQILFSEENHVVVTECLDISSFTFFGNTRTMQERISNLNSHSEFQRKVELRHLLEIAEEVSFYFQSGVCTTSTSALIDFEVQEKKANIAINFKGRLQLIADAGTGWITKIYFLFHEDSFDSFLRANGKPSNDSEKKRVFEDVFTHLILPQLNLLMANPAF